MQCVVLVQKKKLQQQVCREKKNYSSRFFITVEKSGQVIYFWGIFFIERFSYSNQIQRTVFGLN